MPKDACDVLIIDSEDSLRSFTELFAEDLKSSPESERFIAVDTEFIRENRIKPLLCLVQIATEQHAFVIDTLAANVDFSNVLHPIFADPNLTKIFHSASHDIEVLSALWIVNNVYDTQMHEMLISTKACVSYQNLVQKYLGKRLNKDYVISDWTKRPLSKSQLRYSVGDVTFLREIYRSQKKILQDIGRLDWLEDEMMELAERSSCSKVSMDLDIEKPEKNEIAKIEEKLLDWIEEKSLEKKLQLTDIIGKYRIAKICRKGRKYIDKLLKYRGLKNRNLRDFLLFARNIVPENIEYDNSLKEHDSLQIKALKLILEIVSSNNSISQSLIATTHDLEDVLEYFLGSNWANNCATIAERKGENRTLKCLKGWRYDIFGRYVEAFLQKKMSIAIIDGENVGFKSENQ